MRDFMVISKGRSAMPMAVRGSRRKEGVKRMQWISTHWFWVLVGMAFVGQHVLERFGYVAPAKREKSHSTQG